MVSGEEVTEELVDQATDEEPSLSQDATFDELQADGRSFFSSVKLSLALLMLLVIVIFALQNLESVNVDFLIWEFDIPQIVLIILSLIFGITVWEVTRFIRRPKKQKAKKT